ncbi:T9SS type A sorting domain-containing protein, partial [Gelidibacter sp. F2691]|nr:T9SS type A sorting domain-containing protein [Gelidibacter sp. F2691]
MKNYYLLLLTLVLTAYSFGQTKVLYSENFANQNGQGAAGNPPTIIVNGDNWTVNTDKATFHNKAYIQVVNGRFEGFLVSGEAYWYSSVIEIAGYKDVEFKLNASLTVKKGTNNLLKTEYRINGSDQWNSSSTNDILTGEGNYEVSKSGLSGNTLQIRVKLNSDHNNSNVSFDDVEVKGTPNCTAPVDAKNLIATAASQQTELTWTKSHCAQEILVVAKKGSPITAKPLATANYSANANYGSGTPIVAPNEFVVYKGTGTSVVVTGLTDNTSYYYKVYTRYGNVWSTGVSIASYFSTAEYCTLPNSSAAGTSRTSIRYVKFGSINNSTPEKTTTNVVYQDFSSQSTNVNRGALLPLTVKVDNGHGNTKRSVTYAWIDWNNDGVFSANERYYLGVSDSQSNGPLTPPNTNIDIPANAVLGGTRMRIITQSYNGNNLPVPNDPCAMPSDGEVEDYTVIVVPTKITYIYNNGWSPSEPWGKSTSDNDIIIEFGEALIKGNTLSNTITVHPTGALRVPNGVVLSSANGMTLESSSTKYSSLLLDGTISGNVSYTRHVNGYQTVGKGAGGNDLISSPLVSTQNFGQFAEANPNIYSNLKQPAQKLFGPFSKATGSYLTWSTTANASEVLKPGVGYRAASTDNGGFTFTGTVNKSTVKVNIENSGPQFKAYNLVGNPYPAYINIFDFLTHDVDPSAAVVRNIDLMDNYGAVYGYDGDASGVGAAGWKTYNLTSGTVPDIDANMTPGQGFLVTANASKVAAYDLTFAPSMTLVGSTDDFINGRPVNQNAAHVKLQASIGTSHLKTDIFFIEGTTSGLDFGYDAAIYGQKAPAQALYSHLVEGHTGVDLSIQSLAYSALESDITVPVGINVPQGQQITVSIAETSLPENVEVYLEDTENGSFTLLNDTDYVFTSTSKLSNAGRFYLRFSAKTLSVEDNEVNGLRIFTTATPRALHIKGLLTATTTVTVYDLQGRVVVSSILDEGSQANKVDVSSLSVGAYVVKLSNASQQKT